MARDLKQVVADKIMEKIRELDGDVVLYNPCHIEVMAQTERLSLQLKVKTPAGTRYFMVRVQEKY